MALKLFKATDFRCIEEAELELDQQYNLVYGANASGKTSLLEAIAYLGRGKSFRGATTQQLLRHGARDFVLFGEASADGIRHRLGVSNGAGGLETSVDGKTSGGVAALAEALPLQVIDPEVHELIGGGPEARRRYVDWIAFHVEHGYLDAWRRFRRALKQRNAALRKGAGVRELSVWDSEFVDAALDVDRLRERALEQAIPEIGRAGEVLLETAVGFEYRRGWAVGESLESCLEGGVERDRQQGSTQAGPHRADLSVRYDSRQARKLVSRGQQKLLACGMILAATAIVQRRLGRRLLLLVDDPAAELDRSSLGRLIEEIGRLDCQVVATALEPNAALFPDKPRAFHVEHGRFTPG